MRVLSILKMAGYYLWLFIWPASLSVDYSYNSIPLATSLLDAGVWWALLAWGGLMGLAVRSFNGDRRIAFCIGLTILAFLPVANVLFTVATPVSERLFYLPSAGLCLLVGLGWERFALVTTVRPVRLTGLALLTIILLALTARTEIRNQDWMNSETLARSAIRVMPQNAKVYSMLAKEFKDQGKREEALQAYQEAVRLYPDYPNTDISFNAGYGDLLLSLGRLDEGIQALERAAKLNPRWSMLHYNLGLAYLKQRRFDKVEEAWRQALALDPEASHIHSSLSRLLIERGQYAEALAEAEAALQRDPELLLAQGNRAVALEGLGRWEEAAAGYERVLAKYPDFEDLKQRLQNLRARLGHRNSG